MWKIFVRVVGGSVDSLYLSQSLRKLKMHTFPDDSMDAHPFKCGQHTDNCVGGVAIENSHKK